MGEIIVEFVFDVLFFFLPDSWGKKRREKKQRRKKDAEYKAAKYKKRQEARQKRVDGDKT